MGILCIREKIQSLTQTQITEDLLTTSEMTSLRRTSFEFTTEKIHRLEANLLLLFMDHSTDIRRSDHFKKRSKLASKVEQHIIAYLQQSGQDVKRTNHITFDVQIPNFNFDKISIIFCGHWREERRNEKLLKQELISYFDECPTDGINSMVITEFPSLLGVHLNRGVKRLMRQVARSRRKPEAITFCCLNKISKELYLRTLKESKSSLIDSFTTISSFPETDYY